MSASTSTSKTSDTSTSTSDDGFGSKDTPNVKRHKPNDSTENFSMTKAMNDLDDHVGTFSTVTINAMRAESYPDTEGYLNRLERLYRTASFTIEELEESCKLLKSTIGVNSSGTPSGPNQTTTNQTPTRQSGNKLPSPKVRYSKTVPSPTTVAISDFNLIVGTFLAISRTEITNGIKTNELLSEEKQKRLNCLLDAAEIYLNQVKHQRGQIEKSIKKVEPNRKLPTYFRESVDSWEKRVIHEMRTNSAFKDWVKDALQNGQLNKTPQIE